MGHTHSYLLHQEYDWEGAVSQEIQDAGGKAEVVRRLQSLVEKTGGTVFGDLPYHIMIDAGKYYPQRFVPALRELGIEYDSIQLTYDNGSFGYLKSGETMSMTCLDELPIKRRRNDETGEITDIVYTSMSYVTYLELRIEDLEQELEASQKRYPDKITKQAIREAADIALEAPSADAFKTLLLFIVRLCTISDIPVVHGIDALTEDQRVALRSNPDAVKVFTVPLCVGE